MISLVTGLSPLVVRSRVLQFLQESFDVASAEVADIHPMGVGSKVAVQFFNGKVAQHVLSKSVGKNRQGGV
jgi:hypothetical protein